MNYLIVDDEPIAHRIIEGYCAELPLLKKVGNAYNALEASAIISKQNVDLIFLDLNMPKIMGFELLKTLSKPPKIIVTTAYKEYALEGYELDIVDYLLKPFSLQRFLKAIHKIKVGEEVKTFESNKIDEIKNDRFFLKGDKMYHQIQMQDVLFVEAFGNYSKVYFTEKMILTHEKISALETSLMKEKFLRVHKSFIVAIDRIDTIQGNQIYIQDHKIPIGQTYRSKISNLISGK
ncbi:LytTR family DNA-binding domain-containing protein [Aquimarina sp. 2201CG5-10]|uniref:LytR/AlgR family response regulator transcription factor n=1 Tax=Aquimarina callyspongiae TaxID=3098150 RepID=UPI002AB4A063|nr:LytTR family DNA-binding domain-containing protein [Aquimarina sp. 2201CG5-10]MDY8135497.1 LytTR family DNA-binding domain-containing protein [Aquimarina sp. 2201CG5-10]